MELYPSARSAEALAAIGQLAKHGLHLDPLLIDGRGRLLGIKRVEAAQTDAALT